MITPSADFDLGRDNRMKERPEDARRQWRTVEVILERFFHPRFAQRFEIQILADEVGMGKTFVALGLAYSILAHLKQSRTEPDLDGCYQRVLVLTPTITPSIANGFARSPNSSAAAFLLNFRPAT